MKIKRFSGCGEEERRSKRKGKNIILLSLTFFLFLDHDGLGQL
jgi:hypothetical protein